MPKVNEEYFENKKNTIIDTVENICVTKPLYKLTMKDIVKETGLSPGAIYASFSDIDEVIVALINRMSVTVDFMDETEQILQKTNTPEEKIEKLCNYFINLIYSTITAYGKIFHELNTVITDAERKKKIESGMHEIQMYNYVLDALISVIGKNIACGYFKPKVSKESVYALITAFIDGFVRDATFAKCYQFDIPYSVTFEEKDLSKAFAASIIFLLNPTIGGMSE